MLILLLALAADDPNEILKKADSTANSYKDQRFVMTMTIEGSGAPKVAKMETLQKGSSKRLVRFLAPGDVKGTAILMDGSAMYMYMPQFQKVRRIASHSLSQGFMDSDFTQADMGSISFSSEYTATLSEDGEKSWKLHLLPRPGVDGTSEALDLTIDKGNYLIAVIEYFSGGKPVRRQTRAVLKTFPGTLPTPTVITMQDLTKAHKTTMVMDEMKVNLGLPDNVFTKQALEQAQ
jgi:outer membrane lipoprotein-sorting protein